MGNLITELELGVMAGNTELWTIVDYFIDCALADTMDVGVIYEGGLMSTKRIYHG